LEEREKEEGGKKEDRMIQLQARVKYVEENEKCTRFFFRQVKINHDKKHAISML